MSACGTCEHNQEKTNHLKDNRTEVRTNLEFQNARSLLCRRCTMLSARLRAMQCRPRRPSSRHGALAKCTTDELDETSELCGSWPVPARRKRIDAVEASEIPEVRLKMHEHRCVALAVEGARAPMRQLGRLVEKQLARPQVYTGVLAREVGKASQVPWLGTRVLALDSNAIYGRQHVGLEVVDVLFQDRAPLVDSHAISRGLLQLCRLNTDPVRDRALDGLEDLLPEAGRQVAVDVPQVPLTLEVQKRVSFRALFTEIPAALPKCFNLLVHFRVHVRD
mmetsp:Transcript_138750/g.442565  ORF Transcript_138750/g.442565 Transcript_138750/m.442565 type:complete len:278 (+) Transcript_138750:25-858(+)